MRVGKLYFHFTNAALMLFSFLQLVSISKIDGHCDNSDTAAYVSVQYTDSM